VEVEIRFGHGICPALDLLDRATEHGVIERTGSWYSFGETRLGQGRENVRTHFLDHPELMKEIRQRVLTCLETTRDKAAKA
jgi:recombination protein RecA